MIQPISTFYPHRPQKPSWFVRLFRKLFKRNVADAPRTEQFIGGLVLFHGKLLSCSEDKSIRITTLDGKTKVVAKFDHPVNYIALNKPQSNMLACSDDGKVYIYETHSFRKIKTLEGMDTSGVRKAEFTSKGKVVAAANSGQAAVWDLQTGKVQLFTEHTATVDALVIHPKKEIAITNDMTGLTLAWDLDTLKVIKRVTEPKGRFIPKISHFGANATCFNEQYMAFGAEEIEIFDYDFNLVRTLKGLPYSPSGMAFCNGILWAGSHYLKGWSLESWKQVFSQDVRPAVYSMVRVSDTTISTGHEYGQVHVWDTTVMISEEAEIAHMSFVNCVISNDQYMVTSGEDDKSIIAWDKEGNPLGRYFGSERLIGLCCFATPHEVVFVDQSFARLLDLKTMQVVKEAKLARFFRFEDCHRNGDELYLTGALQYPRILNLVTFEIAEFPFRTAFRNFSNRVGDEIAICGYTSVPNEMKESFKPEKEGEKLLEAPLVILDLASKKITKEFWFEAAKPFDTDEFREETYPAHAHLDKNFIIAGYNNGSVVKWDRRTGDYSISEYEHDDGMEGIYVTPKGNIVLATYPAGQLVVLNSSLKVEKMLEFDTSVWARYYDAEKNLVIVSDTDTEEMLFFDADTLELKRTELFKDPRKIYKFGGRYYVFSSREAASFLV